MIKYTADHSNESVAEALKGDAKVPLSGELDRLANQIDTDIRDNLPPQMLAVVVGVLKMVEDIAEVPNEDNQ